MRGISAKYLERMLPGNVYQYNMPKENYPKYNVFKTLKSVKSVHFGHVHTQLFAPVNTDVREKILSLSYHVIVIFEQLILFFKGSFSR